VDSIQAKIASFLAAYGYKVKLCGSHKNIYQFSDRGDFFQCGSLLFKSGHVLENSVQHALRYGVSKQAVGNWLYRDGKRVAIQFNGERGSLFIVDGDTQGELGY